MLSNIRGTIGVFVYYSASVALIKDQKSAAAVAFAEKLPPRAQGLSPSLRVKPHSIPPHHSVNKMPKGITYRFVDWCCFVEMILNSVASLLSFRQSTPHHDLSVTRKWQLRI